ncbi:MAG: hypothetical protein ACRCUY_10865 [Thermoguttaceae bacterium]
MPFLILSIGLLFGFFVDVCDEKLVVRMGFFRIKVLTVILADIQSIEIVTFRPIRDFGGWGIRFGRDNVLAYFMSGTQGVKIITKKTFTKKYLIGSDTPNRLEEVLLEKCQFLNKQTD